MAMELLEGENLAQRIKRKKRLSPQETARVLSHIGRAIARAHEAGIVHRDLKPENVFLVKNEDEELAKVLDFGVAKVESHALSEGTRTRTGSILGTPFYMSPEQAQGNRTVDSRSDLWSMGVIAFECLTGKRPFYSDGLGDLVLAICVRDIPVPSEVASVPIGFDAWWHRAVARDPDKRFQTAKELTESLREALGIESREPAREAPHAAPDIEVTSAPETARDTPPTDPVPGMHASGVVTSGPVTIKADDVALPNAATIQAPLPAEVPALTERQFSTTQKSPPSAPQPSSDGTGIVIGVAAAALFVGLIAGVFFLRSQRQDAADQQRALPPPLPVAVHQPSEPKVKAKATPSASAAAGPSASADKPLLEFLPGEPSSSSAAPAAATPVEPRPAAAKPESSSAPAVGAGSASPAVPANSGTGGAWVKPAWAIPDGDPVRRAPINE
jgi:serine/threonine-protein kinase